MTLTTKEKNLLEDMKGQEQLCITKYEAYAERALELIDQLAIQISPLRKG